MPKAKEDNKKIWELIDGPGVKVDKFSPDNEDAVRMMLALDAQPRVRTRVPREAKDPVDAIATVIVNSVRVNILKGVAVDLPQQISDIIEESYYKTEKAMAPTQRNPFSGQVNEARLDMKSDAERAML